MNSLRVITEAKGKRTFTVATHGDKLFGGVARTEPENRHPVEQSPVDIYEYVDGQWKYVFTWEWKTTSLASFKEHQFSEYMGSCIVQGTAASEKL